ncbi:hypothetical protein C8R46DRAFT_465113 [Mycena filopes]|nr:hypothetical protein C8R46DRAFT_465113 [Mycena filopes]
MHLTRGVTNRRSGGRQAAAALRVRCSSAASKSFPRVAARSVCAWVSASVYLPTSSGYFTPALRTLYSSYPRRDNATRLVSFVAATQPAPSATQTVREVCDWDDSDPHAKQECKAEDGHRITSSSADAATGGFTGSLGEVPVPALTWRPMISDVRADADPGEGDLGRVGSGDKRRRIVVVCAGRVCIVSHPVVQWSPGDYPRVSSSAGQSVGGIGAIAVVAIVVEQSRLRRLLRRGPSMGRCTYHPPSLVVVILRGEQPHL